ncbi:MAG: response regulator [Chloroflexi bacterium]|nr:response regulator [Chloroflexota bacterium]
MTIPPDVLKGFVAEAHTYIHQMREALGELADDELAEVLCDKLDVLSGSAEMFELGAVASTVEPVAARLAALAADPAQEFPAGLKDDLASKLDALEHQLAGLLPDDDQPQGTSYLPDMPPELLDIFVAEAQEHNQTIQRGLQQLKDNLANTDQMRHIRRAAHTLKGAAASVGFSRMAGVAHLIEDMLDFSIDHAASHPLTDEGYTLLSDAAYVLECLLEPDTGLDLDAFQRAIEDRFQVLVGDAAPQGAPPDVAPSEDEEPAAAYRPEAMLRLPLATVETLISRVGELIINQGAFGEELVALRTLLNDLGYTSQRLERLAANLDERIENESLGLLKVTRDATPDLMFDAIELDRYTALYQIARELEEIASDTSDISKHLGLFGQDFSSTLDRERRLTSDLQEGLVSTRLMAFSEIVPRLERIVQHTAQELGKAVDFTVTGADTRVDKTILDPLLEPLTHLLRNAVDHGIEPPDERINTGKSPRGTIQLNVVRDRGRIVLTLSDNGCGISPEAVRAKALKVGLIEPDAVLSDEETVDLIFADGFSIADRVTQTSGRGVGMSIVRRSIGNLQGTVRVKTAVGRGTTFILSIPVTLAIIRALFCISRGIAYAVPLEQIGAVLRLNTDLMASIDDDGILRIGEERYIVKDLGEFTDPEQRFGRRVAEDASRYGLVVDLGEYRSAVLVDRLTGIRDAVVKSLGNHLRRVHGVSGATIAGDGSVSLILDLIEIIEEPEQIDVLRPAPREVSHAQTMHVLVVDDSPSVRRVVSGFLESIGWQVTAARDGIEALELLERVNPDAALVDIEMPRMNGYELLATIKETPGLSALPVVMLTSRSAAKHKQRAEALNVDGYLVKPYQEEQLVRELTRVVQRKVAL